MTTLYCSKKHFSSGGAVNPTPQFCTKCNTENNNHDWYCKNCKHCLYCDRILKKYFNHD